MLAEGDLVQALWHGGTKWYSGKVTRFSAAERTCDVLYDDGDLEPSVPVTQIRIANGACVRVSESLVLHPDGKNEAGVVFSFLFHLQLA